MVGTVAAQQEDNLSALGARAIAALHPCVIYRFLQDKSPEACLAILPLLSDEQFVRLFDYDVWQRDRLSPAAAFRWLDLYRRLDEGELLHRFRSLDEEYQLAILSPLLILITHEQFEQLAPRQQDSYVPLPCHTLYYTIKSEQPEVREAVSACIEILLTQDMEWTYALLRHAAACLANEQEMLMLQFRTARMEEDGYVSLAENHKIFVPIDLDDYRQASEDDSAALTSTVREDWFACVIAYIDSQHIFSAETLAQVQLKLLFCSNTLCAATFTEVSDRRGAQQLLRQAQAIIGLGLDYLTNGDLQRSAALLADEHSHTLFRVGMTLIYRVQEELLLVLEHRQLAQIEVFQRLYKMRKWQSLHDFMDVHWLDALGYEQLEVLKGIFARFPYLLSEEPRARYLHISSMSCYRLLQARAQRWSEGL